jgi:hypothetical protein
MTHFVFPHGLDRALAGAPSHATEGRAKFFARRNRA